MSLTHHYNLRKRKNEDQKPNKKSEPNNKKPNKNKDLDINKEPKEQQKHATVHIVNINNDLIVQNEQDKLKIHTNMIQINKYNDDPSINWFIKNCYHDNKNDIQNGKKSSFCLSIDDIKQHYPVLIPLLKRGDLVENIHESGYRSQGVYCYDGQELVSQEKRYDDYGNPTSNFKLIHEFPPGYWDECTENNIYEPEHNSSFYWHGDQSYHEINLNDFDATVKIKEYQDFKSMTDQKSLSSYFAKVPNYCYQFSFIHKSKKYLVLVLTQ